MADIFNNKITYDKKWDTNESSKYLQLLEKYFCRTDCGSSCPSAWAKEVYELLTEIDKEFGIARNTSTLGGYTMSTSWYYCLSVGPYVRAAGQLYYNFFGYKQLDQRNKWQREMYESMSIPKKFLNAFRTIGSTYTYGARIFMPQVVNPILNKLLKPKVHISQVKEKYGEFLVYFSGPEWLEDHINNLIAKTEVRLAMKGAYYSLESLWDKGMSHTILNDWHPDDINIETGVDMKGSSWKNVKKTTHRKAMKELDLDLKEIAQKVEERKAKQDEEAKQKV